MNQVCYQLQLDQIAPGRNVAFSPNLYEWMKKRAHFYADGTGTPQTVWRVKSNSGDGAFFEGSLMLGRAGDHGDFLGVRLMNVLCEGRKATSWCFPNLLSNLEPVEDFWDRYVRVGRCAIDPDHSIHYLDDRWRQTAENARTCHWCGVVQTRRTFQELVEGEAWA